MNLFFTTGRDGEYFFPRRNGTVKYYGYCFHGGTGRYVQLLATGRDGTVKRNGSFFTTGRDGTRKTCTIAVPAHHGDCSDGCACAVLLVVVEVEVVGGGGGGDAGTAAGRSTPPPRYASMASVQATPVCDDITWL